MTKTPKADPNGIMVGGAQKPDASSGAEVVETSKVACQRPQCGEGSSGAGDSSSTAVPLGALGASNAAKSEPKLMRGRSERIIGFGLDHRPDDNAHRRERLLERMELRE
jgi:hypothetical protein